MIKRIIAIFLVAVLFVSVVGCRATTDGATTGAANVTSDVSSSAETVTATDGSTMESSTASESESTETDVSDITDSDDPEVTESSIGSSVDHTNPEHHTHPTEEAGSEPVVTEAGNTEKPVNGSGSHSQNHSNEQPTEPKPTNPTNPPHTEPTNPPAPTNPTNPPAPTNPPHTHNYVKTVVAPTCTSKGYTQYKCSGCGDSYTCDYKNALGHDYKTSNSVAATCTSDGYTEKKCSRCGDTQRTTIPALGHNYKEVGTTPATCTAPSSVQYECSRCGDTYQQTVGDALGHSWVHHDAETHWVHGVKCYCGAIFWSEDEWTAHADQYIHTDEEDAHAGYRSYSEEIIDKPAYRECSRCGLIQSY